MTYLGLYLIGCLGCIMELVILYMELIYMFLGYCIYRLHLLPYYQHLFVSNSVMNNKTLITFISTLFTSLFSIQHTTTLSAQLIRTKQENSYNASLSLQCFNILYYQQIYEYNDGTSSFITRTPAIMCLL